MQKTNKIMYRLLILFFLITVLLNACADSPEAEKILKIKLDRLDPAGVGGSIDAEIQYLPESGGISLTIINNTAYEMSIGDPAVLYKKTLGEMYEALYPSLSDLSQGTAVIAGIARVLPPGDNCVIGVLPRSVKLSQGEYRISLGTIELVDPKTGEVCFLGQNEFLHFNIP
ncbi:MAG: hypothetical protein J5496_06055 [Lachnospiraceae bacterium]|nr:hypothetical protein [Lachnospiraceae bacterium]